VAEDVLSRLAALVCRYSLEVEKGHVVVVESPAVAQPFLVALVAELTDLGAHTLLFPSLESVETVILSEASRAQLERVTAVDKLAVEIPDRAISIWCESNTRRLSAVPAGNQAIERGARRALYDRFFERAAADEVRWCGITLPSNAQAQEAGMAQAHYRRFVFDACKLAEADPVAAWREQAALQEAVVARLGTVSSLRIVAEGTDLTVDVSGRPWISADGRENMPDGEVYTSPHELATEGHISFTFDAPFNGRLVSGAKLWFENGRVVRSEAERGEAYLREMLEVDDGASLLGEVAFGLNDQITRATRNVGLDEKIGGTCHVALGRAFPESGGTNASSLHWDMVCDLRSGGEVYGDGELIARDGVFL
jgi:aminopeptidase